MVGLIIRASAIEELTSYGKDNQLISQINIKLQLSHIQWRKSRGNLGVTCEDQRWNKIRQWLK